MEQQPTFSTLLGSSLAMNTMKMDTNRPQDEHSMREVANDIQNNTVISLLLPRSFTTLNTPPTPMLDNPCKIGILPEKVGAILEFRGLSSSKNCKSHARELVEQLATDGVSWNLMDDVIAAENLTESKDVLLPPYRVMEKSSGEGFPWSCIPPLLKLNKEIWIDLDEKQVGILLKREASKEDEMWSL